MGLETSSRWWLQAAGQWSLPDCGNSCLQSGHLPVSPPKRTGGGSCFSAMQVWVRFPEDVINDKDFTVLDKTAWPFYREVEFKGLWADRGWSVSAVGTLQVRAGEHGTAGWTGVFCFCTAWFWAGIWALRLISAYIVLAFFKKPSPFSFKLLHCIIPETRGDSGWKSEEKKQGRPLLSSGWEHASWLRN